MWGTAEGGWVQPYLRDNVGFFAEGGVLTGSQSHFRERQWYI